MHDPLTMAFRIQVPRLTPYKHGWDRRSRWLSTVATVWHRDPSGHDSTTCSYRDHLKHPHHWRIQLNTWQGFRQRWLDRCAWCGKGARPGDYVNMSRSWDAPRRPWWRHTDCFHQECSAIHEAHSACLCTDGVYESELSGWGYGMCARCGKRREWRSEDRRDSPVDDARRILASIPAGQRDAAKYQQVRELWAEHNQARHE